MSEISQPSKTNAPLIQPITTEMPKGGGAIQGMGESFSVGAFTGTSSLSFPLPEAGVRTGPQLSLSYSSGSGNGLFGLGWNLSRMSIRRNTSKGTPRYPEVTGESVEPDIFMLGGDYLIPVFNNKSRSEGDFAITRYQPRTEGSFSLIECYAHIENPALTWWKISDKEGNQHILGKNAQAKVANTDNDRQVFEWLIEESVTPLGEHIHYIYKQEKSQSDDLRSGQYLKRVRYGNTVADSHSWMLGNKEPEHNRWLFELVLDYGEHGECYGSPSYNEVNPWVLRQDPMVQCHTGFINEVNRLCQRVILYQQIDTKTPVATQGVILEYSPSHYVTQLRGITPVSYERDSQQPDLSLPPVDLDYSVFSSPLTEMAWQDFNPGLPGLNQQPYQLIDLYGDGIPGILYNDGQSFLYKPAKKVVKNDGHFQVDYGEATPLEKLPTGGYNQALMDITGDGHLDQLLTMPGMAGFFNHQGHFITFDLFPTEFNSPDASLIDMTGNGLPDVVMAGPRSLRFYPNLGKGRGFGLPRELDYAPDKALPSLDANEHIFVGFVDALGSGQQHLVRLDSQKTPLQLECWPNLGHGQWGEKVILDIPAADLTTSMHMQRLRFADLDGSGAADLVYLDQKQMVIWRNKAGNGFNNPETVAYPENLTFSNLCQVSFADVFGNGSSCMVISRLDTEPEHWVYNFSGLKKPYMLERINNNMGAETTLSYRSSVHEWLDEKKPNPAKKSDLPFPVQLVEKVCCHDEIGDSTLSQHYRYRQGYYDREEREFRGFGLVLQQDCEQHNTDDKRFMVEPCLTRTWFHTGAPDGNQIRVDPGAPVAEQCFHRDEFLYKPGSVRVENKSGQAVETETLSVEQQQHIGRALQGSLLRQESIAADPEDVLFTCHDEAVPFTVSLNRYCVRELQGQGDNQYPVLMPYQLETVGYQYDQISYTAENGREYFDPQCSQQITLTTDQYGHTTEAIAVNYPRRSGTTEHNEYRDKQQEVLRAQKAISSVHHFDSDNQWRLGLPVTQASYDVEGLSKPDSFIPYDYEAISAMLADKPCSLLQFQRYFYADPATGEQELSKELPAGQVSSKGLVSHVETAEHTLNQLKEALQPVEGIDKAHLTELMEEEGGFISLTLEGEQLFLNPGQRAYYDTAENFCRVVKHSDPFHLLTHYGYDDFNLFVTTITNPLGMTETTEYDYHHMAPFKYTDINDNIQEVKKDSLGRVIATSFRGTEGSNEIVGFGDLTDFELPVSTLEQALDDPDGAMGCAAHVFFYEPCSWMPRLSKDSVIDAEWQELIKQGFITPDGRVRSPASGSQVETSSISRKTLEVLETVWAETRQPPHSATFAADRYFTDSLPAAVRVSLIYGDGFGRELQSKALTEGGPSYVISNGKLEYLDKPEEYPSARWLTSGRVKYNKKGDPVQQYHPYYLNTPYYVSHTLLDQLGYSDTLFYDAVGRHTKVEMAAGETVLNDKNEVIATIPYFRRTGYHPWYQVAEDENDTLHEVLKEKECLKQ